MKLYRDGTALQSNSLEEARCKMRKAIDTWFELLPDFMPAVALEKATQSDYSPEKEILRMPSDFTHEARGRLGLEELSKLEFKLWIGQAYDALNKLRNALGLKSFLVRRKYKLAGGQPVLTRTEAEINRAGQHVEKWKEVYNRAYEALKRLHQGDTTSTSEEVWKLLKPLQDGDCVMLSEWMEDNRFWREHGEQTEARAAERGGGRKELPWFWKMQFKEGSEDEIDTAVSQWATDSECQPM